MDLQASVQELLLFRPSLWLANTIPQTAQVVRPAGFRAGIPMVSLIVVGCSQHIRKTQVDGPAGFGAGIPIVSAIFVCCQRDPAHDVI